jgi:hypothetical protein
MGRWADRAWGMGQMRHGVKVMRRVVKDAGDPPTVSGDEYEEWMRDHSDIFDIDDVETLACRWYPLRKPTVFVWEYDMPVLDAFNEYQVDGEKVGKDKGKKYRPTADKGEKSGLKWVGDDYAHGSVESTLSETVHVTVVEYEDPARVCPVCTDEHYLWSGCEIISGKGKKLNQGDVVNEYDLYWRGPSFMVTPGRTSNDRDPDLYYRPFLHAAFVHAANCNWATTRLMQIANEHTSTSGLWGYISKDAPAQFLESIKENGWVFNIEDAAEGEIKVMPPEMDIRPFPMQLQESLVLFEQQSYARLQDALPNRWVTGQAYEEASDSTGTATERQTQQAWRPFSFLLTQSDKTIQEDFFNDGVLHYIRLTDHLDKETYGKEHPERRYYVRLNEDINQSLKKGGAEDGQEVYMSASILAQGPKLVLKTSPETLMEQNERRRQALEGFNNPTFRVVSQRELLEAFGYTDTEKKLRELDEENVRNKARAIGDKAQEFIIATLMAAVAEIDPNWLMGQLGMAGGGEMGGGGGGAMPPGPAQPTVRLNALGNPASGALPTGGGGV